MTDSRYKIKHCDNCCLYTGCFPKCLKEKPPKSAPTSLETPTLLFPIMPPKNEILVEPNILPNQNQINADNMKSTEETQYCCNVCKKMFYNKLSLARHTVNFHSQGVADVEIMPPQNEIVVVPNILLNQINSDNTTSTEKTQNCCNVCKKIFYNKFSLERHTVNFHSQVVANVEKIKKYVCSCGKSFTHTSSLNRHKQKHLKEQPLQKLFECKFCSKIFSERQNMKRHIKGIHEYKRYTCEICHKTFFEKSYLKFHYHKKHK